MSKIAKNAAYYYFNYTYYFTGRSSLNFAAEKALS